MSVVTNGRLEYEMDSINVTYPDIGQVTYTGSYPLIVSNQWSPPTGPPEKGDVIVLEGKRYRILKLNNNIAELYGLYTVPAQQFGSSGAAKYFDSPIDKYLNETFYSELSDTIQNAIIEKQIAEDSFDQTSSTNAQYIYKNSDQVLYFKKLSDVYTYGTPQQGTRKCYLISLSAILNYCNATPGMTEDTTTFTKEIMDQLSPANTETIIFNTEANSADYHAAVAWQYNTGTNEFSIYYTPNLIAACPAFQIDLSKVKWRKV